MTKNNLILLMSLILSNLSFAMELDEGRVGNGSGEAERNIVFAMSVLNETLLHLQNTKSVFTVSELEIINNIAKNLGPKEVRLRQINFKSEKKDPGFFLIDGNIKIAKTWTEKGAPIYFNTDLLYKVNHTGEIIPYSISRSTSLLLHELGHQTGVEDCQLLDQMATKAELEIRDQTSEFSFIYRASKITLNTTTYYDQDNNQHAKFTLATADDFLDLSPYLYQQIKCPDDSRSVITSLKIENVHRSIDFKVERNGKDIRLTQPIEFWGRLRCQKEDRTSYATYQQLKLDFITIETESKRIIEKQKIHITQKAF